MSSFTNHPSRTVGGARGIYKGLHVGDSGTGKTGALVSLIEQGYKLRVLDFEDGLDPLGGYIKKPELLTNVSYHTLKDQYTIRPGSSYVSIKKAPSFQRAMALLEDWKDEDAPDGTYGAAESWGDDTILVIDTLGSWAKASFRMVLQSNGVVKPSGEKGGPEITHYGTAQDNIDNALDMLTTPDVVPCHLIVNAHWTFQETDAGLSRPFPATIGKALNPKVAQKFNNMLGFAIKAGQRKILTQVDGVTALKTSKPINTEYPIATGLAEIFRAIVGPPPSEVASA